MKQSAGGMSWLVSLFSSDDKQLAILTGRITAWQEKISKLSGENDRRTGAKQKIAEIIHYDLEMRDLRIKAMENGTQKQIEQINLEFDKEKLAINQRQDLSDKQKNLLIAGYEAIRQAKLKALTVDSGLLSEIDKQIKDLESQRPLAKAVEDIALIDEKLRSCKTRKIKLS